MRTPCIAFVRTGLASVALLCAIAPPALAVCPICNSAVRFDRSLATCFQLRAEDEIRRAEREGRGFVIVDLSDCERVNGRGGLPTDPRMAADLDDSFIADAESLRCLGKAIAGHADGFEPAVLFELTEACP